MKSILSFFRRNALYLIIAFCILAIGLTVTLVAINKGKSTIVNDNVKVDELIDDTNPVDASGDDTTPVEKKEDPTPIEPVDETIIFATPVSSFSRTTEYTDKLYYNSTLNRYQSHKAIDFFAEEGTSVLAAYDGTVESVTNGVLEGYTVVIDHGNGLKTIYNSLLDGDNVSVGDFVKKGDVIGEVSSSNRQEYKEGAHLHFEVKKDGAIINPEEYLITDNK